MFHVLINLTLYKIGWLACILGAASGSPWLGPVVVPLIVAIHLLRAGRPGNEMVLILTAGAVGLVWESLLVSAGLLKYPEGMLHEGLAPPWIVAMWLLFGTTLNIALGWLKGRPVLAALTGAIAGPLAFVAGQGMGAVTFPDPGVAIAALAAGWALLLPGLMIASERLDRRPLLLSAAEG